MSAGKAAKPELNEKMITIAINAAITEANGAIFNTAELDLVKDFGEGIKAYANATGTKVAIFADYDENESYMMTGWTGHATKTLAEIADGLFS